MAFIPRRASLLLLLMAFAGFGMIVRLGQVVNGLNSESGVAQAQEAQPQESVPTPASPQQEDAANAQPVPEPVNPLDLTRSELEMLQNLSQRRAELDQREADLDLQENLLLATEQRIDGKIQQLQDLETRIAQFVAQHQQRENAQLDSVVKVYEAMKPKDAAQIFERLDMKIQIDVATRMKETKMAPILAAMTPEGAQLLTTELASRVEIPDIEG